MNKPIALLISVLLGVLFVLGVSLGCMYVAQAQSPPPKLDKIETLPANITSSSNLAAPDPLELLPKENEEIAKLLTDSSFAEREVARAQRIKADKTISDDVRILADDLIMLYAPLFDKQQFGSFDQQANRWFARVKDRAKCDDCTVDLQKRRLVKPTKQDTATIKP